MFCTGMEHAWNQWIMASDWSKIGSWDPKHRNNTSDNISCVQYMPANRPKMSDVITMLLDRKQMEDVQLISESASEPKFGSFNSNFTSSSCFGQEGNISMSSLAQYWPSHRVTQQHWNYLKFVTQPSLNI